MTDRIISLMFTGIDQDSLAVTAIHSMGQIQGERRPYTGHLPSISIDLPQSGCAVPAKFWDSTMLIFDCARVCIDHKNQCGTEIWTELLDILRTFRSLNCRQDCPLIFLFINAHRLEEVNLMKLRAFIEVCYTERLVWIGWDPRWTCPRSIVSRFVVKPVSAATTTIADIRKTLQQKIWETLCDIDILKQGEFDENDKTKFILGLRKTCLRMLCLPIDIQEICGVLRGMFMEQIGGECVVDDTQAQTLKMIQGGPLMPHLSLEQFILKVCEDNLERGG